jgi:hypothetical protein
MNGLCASKINTLAGVYGSVSILRGMDCDEVYRWLWAVPPLLSSKALLPGLPFASLFVGLKARCALSLGIQTVLLNKRLLMDGSQLSAAVATEDQMESFASPSRTDGGASPLAADLTGDAMADPSGLVGCSIPVSWSRGAKPQSHAARGQADQGVRVIPGPVKYPGALKLNAVYFIQHSEDNQVRRAIVGTLTHCVVNTGCAGC